MKATREKVIKIDQIARAININDDKLILYLQKCGYKNLNLLSHVDNAMLNKIKIHFKKEILYAEKYNQRAAVLLREKRRNRDYDKIFGKVNKEKSSPPRLQVVPIKKQNSVSRNFIKRDFWRTWFIDECDKNNLFGVTDYQREYICKSYSLNTKIFLDDAPYNCQKKEHRICGPFKMYNMENLPNGAVPLKGLKFDLVIYKQCNPNTIGPWRNKKGLRRLISIKDGFTELVFDQTASRYKYFPYRFGIRRSTDYVERLFSCTGTTCPICKKLRFQGD